MQRLRLSLLSLLCLLLPTALFAQTLVPPEKILNDMIIALGGQAFMDVQDIYTTGRYFSFSHGQLTGGDYFVDYLKFPDMERMETGVGTKKTIQINRGDIGWRIPGKKTPLAMTATDLKEYRASFLTSFDYVTRFVLDQHKTTLDNNGTEMLDFNLADVIEIRDPEKNLIDYYINRDTHLPERITVRRTDETIIHEELLNNWHRFGSMMVPVNVTHITNGQKTMEIHIENAEFNTSMPDGLFADPKK